MLPLFHFITSATAVLIVNYFFPASLFNIFLGMLAGVFIDLDHFLIKIVKDRNFNVFKIFFKTFPDAKKFSEEIDFKEFYLIRLATHLLILILFLIFYPVIPVIVGISTHLAVDFIYNFFS